MRDMMTPGSRKFRITVLNDYQDVVRTLAAFEKITDHDVTIWNDIVDDIDALCERLADTEILILIRERTPITAELLARLPKLKLISQNGHVPHIDLDACTRHGVVVCSALSSRPSYSTVELTWGLIIAATRNIVFEAEALKNGHWQSTIGLGLRGRTLGIFGYGKLGSMVAAIGQAFGMEVLVWGRDGSQARARGDGFAVAPSRAAFFRTVDVLSLHLRLDENTIGTISQDDLDLMKPTALLVNTSRAELIQPGALHCALKKGRPGFAAVDVYESEPLRDVGYPLLSLPNALCTPHLGYVERDNYEFAYGNAFDQVVAYATGTPINVHNKDVLKLETDQ